MFNVRMPCFTLPDGLVVITHGFVKKRDKLSPAEIQRVPVSRPRTKEFSLEKESKQPTVGSETVA